MTRLVRLILLLAGVTVLILIAARIGMAAMLDMTRRTGWAFVWVLVLYTLHVGVRALALGRSLPETNLRFRDIWRVRLAGEAIEMLTFTGPFLAEPSKGLLLKRLGIDTSDAFGAIAVEFLFYMMVAFWMAGFSLVVLRVRGVFGEPFEVPVAVTLGVLMVFTAGFVYAAVARRGLIIPVMRLVSRALRRPGWMERAADRIEPVENFLVRFMHDRPGRLVEVLGLELVGHVLLAMEIWVVMRAIGSAASWADAFTMEGAIKLIAAVFFFVPGQLGAAEGVYVLLADALRFGPAAGLTLALIRRVRALLIATVGLAALTASPKPSA
ncbi:MAG: hypothetical protein DMF90_24140 [Acidobacteria bacterium]|nr:MAG: hypothetical protein DMF90_24140 [Acidobacteriota bacterium]